MRPRKKKFTAVADVLSACPGVYAGIFGGRRLGYVEFCGLWLNRRRAFHWHSATVAWGVSIALGGVNPGDDFWSVVADGAAEAKMLKFTLENSRTKNAKPGGF